MGVNIDTGSDPDNFDLDESLLTSQEPITLSPTEETTLSPADEANASTLSQSTALAEGLVPSASNPTLTNTSTSNFFTQLADAANATVMAQTMMAMQQTYADTMNAILDNWSKQIEITAQLNKEASQREDIRNQAIDAQRLQSDIVNEGVISESIQNEAVVRAETLQELNKPTSQEVHLSRNENFNDWWNKASSRERFNYLNENGQQMVASYLEKTNDPAIQNNDLARTVMPLVMAQTMVVNPLAAQITMPPPEVNLAVPTVLNGIPQVNLLLPTVMFNSAAEASLSLIGKQSKNAENKDPKKIDEDFVNELGKRTLINTNSTDSWLRFKESSYEMLNDVQKSAVQTCVNLMALTSVLIFDVKSQGKGSNLSKEEFDSMLSNGVEGRDVLNDVIGRLNNIFSELQEKGKEEYAQYYAFVENFINSVAARNYDLDNLHNFSEVISYAYQEIGPSDRAVQVPD